MDANKLPGRWLGRDKVYYAHYFPNNAFGISRFNGEIVGLHALCSLYYPVAGLRPVQMGELPLCPRCLSAEKVFRDSEGLPQRINANDVPIHHPGTRKDVDRDDFVFLRDPTFEATECRVFAVGYDGSVVLKRENGFPPEFSDSGEEIFWLLDPSTVEKYIYKMPQKEN